MTRSYLVMWDQLGLECLIDLTELEYSQTIARLQGTTVPEDINLGYLKWRARANPQRHYEIYAFRADDTITEQDLRDQFDRSPQSIVDLIRERGEQLYSDREKPSEKLIR